MRRGVLLRGGGVEADGKDVTVEAPTPDLRNQAVVSNPRTDALLLNREEPLLETACFVCRGSSGYHNVVQVKFPKDEGYRLTLCLGCIKDREPGRPILIDMEFVE